MAESLDNTLLEAYELIEANRIDEARQLLTPLLSQYPDEPDLWWVYSHAVESRDEAQRALQRVVELDPGFTEAAELLADMEPERERVAAEPPPQPVRAIRPLAPPPPPTTATGNTPDDDWMLDDGDTFDEDFEDAGDFDETPSAAGGPNVLLLGGVAAVLVLVSGVVLFFALTNNNQPAATPTAVAGAATATNVLGVATVADETTTAPAQGTPLTADASAANATETPGGVVETEEVALATATETLAVAAETEDASATPGASAAETEEPATATEVATATPRATNTTPPEPTETPLPEPTETDTPTPTATVDPIDLILAELGNFELSENAATVTETQLGETVVVEFCLGEQDRNALLDEALTTLAGLPLEDIDVEAVAVSIYNCESGETFRVIGVTVADALAFQAGDIDEPAFRSSWTVVG